MFQRGSIRFTVLVLLTTTSCTIFLLYLLFAPTIVAQFHQIQLQERMIDIVSGASIPSNGNFYKPQSISINGGTLVKWVNLDKTFHTVTFVIAGIYDSGIISPNGIVSHTFFSQGVFNYFCRIHPFMTGVVTVV
jgi:plastocyanin